MILTPSGVTAPGSSGATPLQSAPSLSALPPLELPPPSIAMPDHPTRATAAVSISAAGGIEGKGEGMDVESTPTPVPTGVLPGITSGLNSGVASAAGSATGTPYLSGISGSGLQAAPSRSTVRTPMLDAIVASGTGSAPSSPAMSGLGEGGVVVQVNKSRCWGCKKKVGLTGFECRCGFVFCGTHRYADQHACTFDFRTYDRDILTKQNQRVAGEKVEKI